MAHPFRMKILLPLLGLLAALHSGLAAALTVSPVHLKMAPAVRTVTFTAINDQPYPATVVAKLRRWQQDGTGKDRLGGAPELVIYPLKAVLKPGHKQEFRVYLKTPAVQARYYRLLIELADSRPQKQGEVSAGQAFSVPMFVEPLLARPLLQTQRDGQSLVVRNTGTGFEFIQALRYADGETPNFTYLLPGAAKRITLPLDQKGAARWPVALVGRQLGPIALR